jgi:phosphatidylserine/phosphatidylglycerophosphate/cardiolipin synthase-like enzyme
VLLRRLLPIPLFLFALAGAACAPTSGAPVEDGGLVEIDGGADVDGGASGANGGAPRPDGGALAPDAGAPGACSATDPRAVPAEVAVFPEAGEAPYVEVLSRAQRSIRVYAYLMGRGGVLDALKRKASEGKSVRVILDASQDANPRDADELTAAGAQVLWSDPAFRFMHAKVILVDEREAFISSGNYSLYFIERERNFGVRIADPEDVADLVALFDADWERRTADLSCTRLLVSPFNARERIISLIGSAQRTLLVESMQLADPDVRTEIARRKQAGVDVRVLLADPGWISANRDAASYLAQRGIPARYRTSPSIHAKAIVVDEVRAFVGSENLSWTSLTSNREVGIVVTESEGVRVMRETFERDWTSATAF